jgi:hypothetical protein
MKLWYKGCPPLAYRQLLMDNPCHPTHPTACLLGPHARVCCGVAQLALEGPSMIYCSGRCLSMPHIPPSCFLSPPPPITLPFGLAQLLLVMTCQRMVPVIDEPTGHGWMTKPQHAKMSREARSECFQEPWGR